ncbi:MULTISPECIES: threonine/serine exporter family protein [unclassified Enterococcus]|uniref:threonine/serine ThrE exporter family protein n=1 Tax=unclassified Enterococcus TaxID=2608891 RepID=UPI0015550C5A|nr:MULTISPECIES: threonine/serine exporter family protein [unclassified Enterococcus]MBS7578238.1 threonine/serine exporter family protein [Enterococcus sp. MMGLQ5-2]MBS7585523.1 threonine/serine exporter family protein [Enterococcus sp. MMGLQ5-1]NPD13382.1 threonine/serine exporter family protein [Enterococcus sp. MMGLQ5-1]NPD38069.1 threonine/serine exporter family protein [Enterococcus sp. MMGLQ5-2]
MDTMRLLGRELMTSGAELKRVEDTLARLVKNSAFLTNDEKLAFDIQVTINSIFLRSDRQVVDFVTITNRNYDLQRISELNQLSREYAQQNISISELQLMIEKKKKSVVRYSKNWLAYALLSASLITILGGSFIQIVLAALVGILTNQIFLFLQNNIINNIFLSEICATFFSGGIGALIGTFFHLDPTLIYIATIIPLVPGILLTNGFHDLLEGYYVSGPIMILESLTTLASLSIGVTLVSMIPFVPMGSGYLMITKVPLIIHIFGSMICSIAFGVTVNTKRELFLPIGVAGAFTWCTYVLSLMIIDNSFINSFLCIVVLSLISHYFAKKFRVPLTMFFVPALVAVVPGITLFLEFDQWIITNKFDTQAILGNILFSLIGMACGSLVGDEIFKLLFKIRRWFYEIFTKLYSGN